MVRDPLSIDIRRLGINATAQATKNADQARAERQVLDRSRSKAVANNQRMLGAYAIGMGAWKVRFA
jgi:hypothetical protein